MSGHFGDEMPAATAWSKLRAWALVLGIAWRASRWRSAAALVSTLIQGSWAPVFAIGLARLTDGIVLQDRDRALDGVAVVVAYGVVQAVNHGFAFALRMRIREMATHRLDLDMVEMAAGIAGIEHMERPLYADRLEALRNQRMTLASAFDSLCWNLSTGFAILTGLGVLAHLDPVLLLIPLFGLPSIFISNRVAGRIEVVRDETAPAMRLFRRLFDIAVSPIAGKELRVFGADRALVARHREESEYFETTWLRTSVRNTIEGVVGQVIFSLGFAVGIGLLIYRAAEGQATAGEVAAGLTLSANVQTQIRDAVNMTQWARASAEAARRFAWLRDHTAAAAEIAMPPVPAPTPARIERGITLEGVGFRYPGTDVDVLRGVDLHVPAGTIVAIVGDNGAGKSTLVKLLARFYEPTEGRILVDATPLSSIPTDEWRGSVSAGFQDFARFELIAAEAIGLGHLPELADDAAHVQALHRAAADDVVGQLPAGLATQLGKAFADGHDLSGGQWQKLALARAMMRRAPLLLLLDEPTAALDAETEHELFDRYAAAARLAGRDKGAITILVSHRFSTVRSADLIVVVDDATVVEHGSHAGLMARGGLYAELFELQASSYR